jgi:hypothetical protein
MNRILAKRYAFCDFSSIVGFPNQVPTRDEWENSLPRFRGEEWEVPAEHLLDFHEFINRLEIVHEDVQIKLFKFSLDGIALDWCRSLPNASVSSLADFHAAFHLFCKEIYSADLLYPKCCHDFNLLNKKSDSYVKYATAGDASHHDQDSDDLQEDGHSIDALNSTPNASTILDCYQDHIASFEKLKDDEQIESSTGESIGATVDAEGSPYLPDLQFKEDSSQLSCLLIEESFQGNIDDYTNDCKAALYLVSDAFDISDLKEELVVKEDLSSFFQEISHDVFSPKIKEEDQQVAHFSKRDQGALSSLIFDENSHEEEQIPFVDLMNNQPIYDSYELNFDEDLKKCQNHTAQLISSSDGEQYCVENSYPEFAEDIEQSFPQISKPECTVFEPGSADNNKQFIMSKEISLQPCSYLQTAEGDSYSQQEVFAFSFIDPFAPYLESLSSLDVRALLSKEGRLFFSFEFHINILWFPAFFVSGSKKSASQLFVWLHWKSDYT